MKSNINISEMPSIFLLNPKNNEYFKDHSHCQMWQPCFVQDELAFNATTKRSGLIFYYKSKMCAFKMLANRLSSHNIFLSLLNQESLHLWT